MRRERLWEGPKPASDKVFSWEERRAWVSAWNLVNYLNGSVPFGEKTCDISPREAPLPPWRARPQDVNSEKWNEYRLGR